jgi:hypothetical protein
MMMMSNNFNVGVAGRYKLVAHKLDGSSRELTPWFNNLILDGGLEAMAVRGTMNKCRVGTGNSTPVVGQTALDAELAEADIHTSTDGYDSATNLYAFRRITYRFPVGAATGNLSEVGVGWRDGSIVGLFSRSRIKDGNGNDTTITVLSDEVLDVIYEFRIYRPTADAAVNVSISGTTYECSIRAANFGSWRPTILSQFGILGQGSTSFLVQGWTTDATLGTITGEPSGTQNFSGVYSVPVGSYATNSGERVFRATVGLDTATTPIKALIFYSPAGIYQMLLTTPIPKDSTNKLTLDYKLTWARR